MKREKNYPYIMSSSNAVGGTSLFFTSSASFWSMGSMESAWAMSGSVSSARP